MEEVLEYLDNRDDYVIFAGFASFLHTGIESSADIDIFAKDVETVNRMADDFLAKGWKLDRENLNRNNDGKFKCGFKTVEKNNTSFDICYSTHTSEVFLPESVTLEFEGFNLKVFSAETLFLAKIQQMTGPNRKESKMLRDRETIGILRTKIDPDKVKKLINSVWDEFWTKRYY